MYIVYDKTTNKILRNVTEPPILGDNEAVFETTTENQRVDIEQIRRLGTITAGALAPISEVVQARQAAIAAWDLHNPGHGEIPERALPHPASPTGQSPATHYFCFFRGSPDMVNGCVANLDFKSFGVCELADNQEEFLERHGLKVVS
ncbi:MAG TPA: hypothetical protein VG055_25640 [Planctomycetaceae bacterium]|jgi:hypothetical protein|nr:hypothetical protein [Planctomycetaceae bacterium]